MGDSSGLTGIGISNCVSENDLLHHNNEQSNKNDIFITRVHTLADYFNNKRKDFLNDDQTPVGQESDDELVDNHHSDEDEVCRV